MKDVPGSVWIVVKGFKFLAILGSHLEAGLPCTTALVIRAPMRVLLFFSGAVVVVSGIVPVIAKLA